MELLAWLIFFAVAFVGMTNIIVDSKIMLPIREWVKEKQIPFIFGHKLIDMMECPQCTGYWVGMTMWPFALPFLPIEWTFWKVMVLIPVAFFVGCAVSILAPITRALQDWLTLNVTIPENLWNDEKQTDPPGN